MDDSNNVKFLGTVVASFPTYTTKNSMIDDMNAGKFTEGCRVLLTDPVYDSRGNGVMYEYDASRSRMVRVLNYRNYAKLGCASGSSISFVPTTSYTLVPFPTISPNGGTKKIARGLYRDLSPEGSRTTPGWRVVVRLDWAVVKINTNQLSLDLRLGGQSCGSLQIDLTGVTLDATNGNSIIAWAEWSVHPNGNNNASSYTFDSHAKIRYGAAYYQANGTQVQDITKTRWAFPTISDGTDSNPIHPEFELYCKYTGNANTLYIDNMFIQECD